MYSVPQLVKSLPLHRPLHIPKSCKRSPFQAEPSHIHLGCYRKLPPEFFNIYTKNVELELSSVSFVIKTCTIKNIVLVNFQTLTGHFFFYTKIAKCMCTTG